jgi:hypothetical protein
MRVAVLMTLWVVLASLILLLPGVALTVVGSRRKPDTVLRLGPALICAVIGSQR